MPKNPYYVDPHLEQMYFQAMLQMDLKEATRIMGENSEAKPYHKLVKGNVRGVPYSKLDYKTLHYLVIGCNKASAEQKAFALAALMVILGKEERANPMLSNEMLLRSIMVSVSHMSIDVATDEPEAVAPQEAAKREHKPINKLSVVTAEDRALQQTKDALKDKDIGFFKTQKEAG